MSGGWPRSYPLVQVPNPPLAAALAAALVGRLSHGDVHAYAEALFYVALGAWAWGELSAGVNAFRRVLGAGFAIYVVVRLGGLL